MGGLQNWGYLCPLGNYPIHCRRAAEKDKSFVKLNLIEMPCLEHRAFGTSMSLKVQKLPVLGSASAN